MNSCFWLFLLCNRVYADKGAEVVDLLYANPAVTIPVILNRLKQKDKEWQVTPETAGNV